MKNQVYNILIVEDEWINAEFLSDMIISFGHNVIGIAKSADETMEILSSKSCDLIFMDINIKGSVDGIQLAQTLNEKQNIPIVYLTAFGDSDTIADASETNIYGFVIKPFNENQIEAVLNVAISRIKKEKSNIIIQEEKSLLDLGYEYIYNFQRKTIYLKNEPIQFSKNESKILFLFCSSFGHIISSEQIRSYVWAEKNVSESTIRDTILRVRKKLPLLNFENVSGIGYTLVKDIN